MAHPLNSLPKRRGRRPLYPWSEWADGRPWRITRGEDFAVPAQSMAAMIRAHAQRAGTEATALVDGDHVDFQFQVPVEPEKAAA